MSEAKGELSPRRIEAVNDAEAGQTPEVRAQAMIRRSGARLTGPRWRVLGELLRADQPLTHLDLQRRVEAGAEPIDRVTLYRVLDWLADTGLAHRVAGPDRVFRFSAHSSTGPHGHFRCVQCGRMYCLDASTEVKRSVLATLPEGFTEEHVEVTVSGLCAECATAH
jgi:Fur family ferric uptake transcriptional regulator